MSPRQILLSLAAVLVVAGVVLGFRTVSTNDVSCGSVFQPSDRDADFADSGEAVADTLEGATSDGDGSNVAACESARGDAKPLVYGATGLGVLALLVSFTASAQRPTNPDGTPKPSIWR